MKKPKLCKQLNIVHIAFFKPNASSVHVFKVYFYLIISSILQVCVSLLNCLKCFFGNKWVYTEQYLLNK